MSLADITFIQMCRDILENGTSTEGETFDEYDFEQAAPEPK